MKFRTIFFGIICFLPLSGVFAQQQPTPIATTEQIEKISKDVSKVTTSVDQLTQQMKKFFETFSTNQGLRLTEKQQKLLFAFEILNRSEQRLSTLQTFKVSLAERQSSLRLTLARIKDDLLPDSIQKYVAVRGGSLNAEQLRQMRRQALENERNETTKLINEIETSLNQINYEIRQIETFLRSIRERIFGEVSRELADF